eukprot:g34188.t1
MLANGTRFGRVGPKAWTAVAARDPRADLLAAVSEPIVGPRQPLFTSPGPGIGIGGRYISGGDISQVGPAAKKKWHLRIDDFIVGLDILLQATVWAQTKNGHSPGELQCAQDGIAFPFREGQMLEKAAMKRFARGVRSLTLLSSL